MTRRLECPCGASVVLASGYNAEAMTEADVARLALKVNWSSDPPVCPACVGALFICHDCGKRADTRAEDPTNGKGACRACGGDHYTIGEWL